MRQNYETDNETFSATAYRVRRYPGIAFYVLGWETEPDQDTEWTGYEVRTGRVLAVMVGDDRRHSLDPDDVEPLPREEYCGECGQIGCCHDGLDREELQA
jgi:hypothetical protein